MFAGDYGRVPANGIQIVNREAAPIMERISPNSDEIDLLAIARLLWTKRYILIGSTLGFVVAGILVAYAQTTIYKGEIVVNSLNESWSVSSKSASLTSLPFPTTP